MGKIFNKDKKKDETVIASAPDTPETPGEANYVETINQPKQQVAEQPKPVVREIPRCMSQTDINNLIIDIDMKLNYIISKIEE